jgi:hypothetical protein
MSENDIVDVDFTDLDEAEYQARVKEELNHKNFKKWFKGLLKITEVELIFFKVNGDVRNMRCTLSEDKIPEDKRPKGSTTKQSPKGTIAVFDLDKNDWRSFRYDSIKEFTFDLPEDCEYPPHPEVVNKNGVQLEEPEEYVFGENQTQH